MFIYSLFIKKEHFEFQLVQLLSILQKNSILSHSLTKYVLIWYIANVINNVYVSQLV